MVEAEDWSNYLRPQMLVVDDEPVNRQLLEQVFHKEFEIAQARHGREAIDILTGQAVDIVLLDVMMPEINGLEVVRFMRTTPELQATPVVLISAASDTQDIVRGLRMGANDYITKPIDVEVVRARVHTQMQIKRLIDENQRTIEELREAQAIREKFFQIATHDLRNPLSNIRMIEYLLREQLEHDENFLPILDNLLLTVNSMQAVLEDFLSTAALQSGKVDLQLRCLSMEEVLWSIAMQYNTRAMNKGLSIEIPHTEGYILADPARIMQILGNLMSNAIKYSPHGTVIRFWSERRDNGMVRINVADEGAGVPEDERDLLFTEFGRTSTRPTGDESSTGLGLWIVQHLVTLQNGDYGAYFPEEGGSVFWVELPQCDPMESA